MNGMEAKYTAKHIAKMIKRNRGIQKKTRAYFDVREDSYSLVTEHFDKFVISQFVEKETNSLSLEFRAFMIHNAFKKKREFTTAEVEYFNLGENALAAIKEDMVAYSRYRDRQIRQQKAINIVRHKFLDKQEREAFNSWLDNASKFETWFKDRVLEAIE